MNIRFCVVWVVLISSSIHGADVVTTMTEKLLEHNVSDFLDCCQDASWDTTLQALHNFTHTACSCHKFQLFNQLRAEITHRMDMVHNQQVDRFKLLRQGAMFAAGSVAAALVAIFYTYPKYTVPSFQRWQSYQNELLLDGLAVQKATKHTPVLGDCVLVETQYKLYKKNRSSMYNALITDNPNSAQMHKALAYYKELEGRAELDFATVACMFGSICFVFKALGDSWLWYQTDQKSAEYQRSTEQYRLIIAYIDQL